MKQGIKSFPALSAKILMPIYSIILLFSCTVNTPVEYNSFDSKLKPLATKPPMGWNSWNCFGIEVNEEQVKAVADYMAEHLKEYGWEYVVIDAGWYHPVDFKTPQWNDDPEPPQTIDAYGRLLPDTIKFPSARNGAGFKPLADYIHSKGLKFGIHIMRGIPWNAVKNKTILLGTDYTADEIADAANRCEWTHVMFGINHTHAGGAAYYESLIDLYAEWGVDYIKADDMSRPYRRDEIQALSEALQNNQRDIVLSLSPGAAPLDSVNNLRQNAHLWRISNDFWDSWESLKTQFTLCASWAPYIAENNWPDADMLPLGKLRKSGVGAWEASLFNSTSSEVTDEYSRLTPIEQITLMNLWAIFRSPLMMGGYLPENDSLTLELLTNTEIIHLNQNSMNNRVIHFDESMAIWSAESKDSTIHWIAAFNLSDEKKNLSLNLEDAGLVRNKDYLFTNAWTNERKIIKKTLNVILKEHESVLYKISN
jgi:alpha-galactosidase